MRSLRLLTIRKAKTNIHGSKSLLGYAVSTQQCPGRPLRVEILMATKSTAASIKQARKTTRKPTASLPPAASIAAELCPGHVPPERPSSFDPHLLLTKISAGKTSREYQAEDSVFTQGAAADSVFYVQSGKVKLTVVSKRGKKAVIAILPQASFFGEGCLAGQPLRMATASADQKSTIVRIKKHAMVAMLHQEPEFAEQFLAYLLSRNIRMEADLVDHLFNSSEKRLARLLLLIANLGQESRPVPLIAKMSQETVADMIGTTRARVSFFLSRFREMGFIDYSGADMQVNSSLVSVLLHDQWQVSWFMFRLASTVGTIGREY
jgi:CRP/FNR family transcriptional regulator, cyclic AMP receptor protein